MQIRPINSNSENNSFKAKLEIKYFEGVPKHQHLPASVVDGMISRAKRIGTEKDKIKITLGGTDIRTRYMNEFGRDTKSIDHMTRGILAEATIDNKKLKKRIGYVSGDLLKTHIGHTMDAIYSYFYKLQYRISELL